MHLKSALKVTRLPPGAARSVVGQCPSRLCGLSEQCCDVLQLPRDPWIELHDWSDERREKERNTGELLADAVVQFVGQVLPFASDRIGACELELPVRDVTIRSTKTADESAVVDECKGMPL